MGSQNARMPWRGASVLGLLSLLFWILAPTGATDAAPIRMPSPESRPAMSWSHPDGEGGRHHSALWDINVGTVDRLEVAWIYRTGDVSAHEGGRAGTSFASTPIAVDGRLFISTPYSRVIALDGETGREIWTFDPGIDRSDRVHTMVTNRGISTWSDPGAPQTAPCRRRIFLASFDARLFALDAEDGTPCRDFGSEGVLDLARGIARADGEQRGHYKQTAPPAVIGDRVIVGSSIFDGRAVEAPSGAVQAFDARTGETLWRWEPLIDVDRRSAEGVAITAGAANTWATITPDPEHDLVFVPTGSASPDSWGGFRPGDNRYANSLVALDAGTGQVVWHFQAVHHDLWDYDLPTPPALLELERDGRTVPAVALATKMGFLFFFHRLTGEPLFPIEERPVPASRVPGERASPTQPFPVKPAPLHPRGLTPDDAWGLTPLDRAACRRAIEDLDTEMYAPPSRRGTVTYPGPLGGMEWGGLGYDPERRLLITNTNRVAAVTRLVPAAEVKPEMLESSGKTAVALQAPAPWAAVREPFFSPVSLPCTPPPWGMIHAVDVTTGELVWEGPLGTASDLAGVPTPRAWGSPNLGGPLVTGGLAIIAGTMDRRIRALELETGEEVWEASLPASAQSTPMTFRPRRGGRQFLVVNAGGHVGIRSKLGDFVVAFALPEPGAAGGEDR
ncbi:MAG: pyrroloquinoline quinone-dependent dehydrogenase [Gemmatimonadota bacterium]